MKTTERGMEMDWEKEFRAYETELEPGKRDRAYAWMTAIGLQDVDGLKTSLGLSRQGPRKGGRCFFSGR